MSSALGRLIAQRRRDLGMSQREVAERLCAETGRATVTRHELSRYERGRRVPSKAMVTGLANVLKMPISKLTGGSTVDPAFHPTWCTRDALCTAHDSTDPVQAHRTAPIVVDTDDDPVKIHLYAEATPDGTRLSITVTEVGQTYGGSPAVGSGLLAEAHVAESLVRAMRQLLDRVDTTAASQG